MQVTEWYETALTHARLFSNDDNSLMRQKHSYFVSARNDQSVFSVLSKLPHHKDSVLIMPTFYLNGPIVAARSL